MLSYFCVIAAYVILLISTPFIVSSTCFGGNDIIPSLAYKLNLHYSLNKVEPVVLCVGLITFYSYVVLGFLFDVIQALRQDETRQYSIRNSARLDRFEKANRQLRKLFPSFIVSSFLIYANTTRFDALRNSFVILQTILLLLQPLASMCPSPNLGLLCKYFYRSVLCWSLLYATLPRETNYFILILTRFFNTLFTENNNPYYTSRMNNRNNIEQWIL